MRLIESFIKESNEIERIYKESCPREFNEFMRFTNLSQITIKDLEEFVNVYQPCAKLRDQYNMNVRIGSYYPPFGGPEIRTALESILSSNDDAFMMHLKYEKLHPFTDCNGRSGRALWAWKMKDISRGFLETFYFQTLQHFSKLI